MKNFLNSLLKAFVLLTFITPVFVSCNEFDEIWDKIDIIESRLDSIENDLNTQVDALSALLSEATTVSSCNKNDDGSYTIKLSNGTTFNVLPEGTDFSSLISYKVVDGKKYWATYDANGELIVLQDTEGKNIPVEFSVDVKVKDDMYYLVINGVEYATGYDAKEVIQVFSSCTPHKDASGQIYALTFTFGEGLEITVTVDGYKGVIFKLADMGASTTVSEYFIDFASTETFLMDIKDVVDYVMQIPDGWRVKEYTDELTGDVYVDITAPLKETITANAAVASGDLKVISVIEGGKAAISKLTLNTDPFKVYNISSAKAVIEPTYGIQKFVYGIFRYDDFDKDGLVQQVNEFLSSTEGLPAGYHIAEDAIDKTHEDIYGAELDENESYVFWVFPVLYNEGTDGSDAGFYVTEDIIREKVISPISAKISVNEPSVLDADISVRVLGTTSMYAGTAKYSNTLFEEVVYQVNNGIIEPNTESLIYTGPASKFPNTEDAIEMTPNTSYVTWIIPIESGKTIYSVSDIIYKEFQTKDVVSGGNLAVNIGDFTTGYSSLSAPLTSEGAAMIYYAYLTDTESKRLEGADNETKMSKIKSSQNFMSYIGSSADAAVDLLKPETTMWLYAVAISNDGKYGEVKSKSATTKAVTFNPLTLEIEEMSVGAKDAKLKVTVSGGTATDFIYWCGKITDPFWTDEEYCDESKTEAEKYMAANPDADALKKGIIAQDGTITLSNLSMSSTYVFLILAKDETGDYSHCGYYKFNTIGVDLGENYVSSNEEKWETTKEWIKDNIVWDKDAFSSSAGGGQGFASYAFDIKIPTDLTAYISCFSSATEEADIILDVVALCSKSRDISTMDECEDPTALEWIDDRGKSHNASLFFSVYDTYVHGAPTYGYVTYFASNGHNEFDCDAWDSGECSKYAEAVKRYEEKLSIDHWKEWIADNCNFNYQGDPDSEYSYSLTDETKINKLAQAWVDAYTPYYTDRKPILFVNNGEAIRVLNREAMGLDSNGDVIDKVFIVLKDLNGNYYAPIVFKVPNHFN